MLVAPSSGERPFALSKEASQGGELESAVKGCASFSRYPVLLHSRWCHTSSRKHASFIFLSATSYNTPKVLVASGGDCAIGVALRWSSVTEFAPGFRSR